MNWRAQSSMGRRKNSYASQENYGFIIIQTNTSLSCAIMYQILNRESWLELPLTYKN
jgi:hypothetical protein